MIICDSRSEVAGLDGHRVFVLQFQASHDVTLGVLAGGLGGDLLAPHGRGGPVGNDIVAPHGGGGLVGCLLHG